MPAWSLPEFIADVLPSEARKIEELRRILLDLFRSYGYELVMPPMLEYTESLLSGTGRDMGLQMFKLVDQLSGRTMGLRADITPQVARIDAHLLNRDGVTRLCYAGSVLHARPEALSSTREPLTRAAGCASQVGYQKDLTSRLAWYRDPAPPSKPSKDGAWRNKVFLVCAGEVIRMQHLSAHSGPPVKYDRNGEIQQSVCVRGALKSRRTSSLPNSPNIRPDTGW